MSTRVTVVAGNVTTNPQAYETQRGRKVVGFGVATKRRLNMETGEWEDVTENVFVRCGVWGHQGENTAESLVAGDRVLMTGELEQRLYTPAGSSEARMSWQFNVKEIASSLLFATAKPVRRSRRREGED